MRPEISDKRILVVVGHFGSGKTEFAVSLAYQLAREGQALAVVDVDIANPYFRSREHQQPLEALGVKVYSDAFGGKSAVELQTLDPAIRAPLENPDLRCIVDAGGDSSGARVLNQYEKYLSGPDAELVCIVNRNRPETRTVEGALAHIEAIQQETGLAIAGLISNAHMIRWTTAEDVITGWDFTQEVSRACGIPVRAACAPAVLMEEIARQRPEIPLFEMGLYMRESWLDKPV